MPCIPPVRPGASDRLLARCELRAVQLYSASATPREPHKSPAVPSPTCKVTPPTPTSTTLSGLAGVPSYMQGAVNRLLEASERAEIAQQQATARRAAKERAAAAVGASLMTALADLSSDRALRQWDAARQSMRRDQRPSWSESLRVRSDRSLRRFDERQSWPPSDPSYKVGSPPERVRPVAHPAVARPSIGAELKNTAGVEASDPVSEESDDPSDDRLLSDVAAEMDAKSESGLVSTTASCRSTPTWLDAGSSASSSGRAQSGTSSRRSSTHSMETLGYVALLYADAFEEMSD